ncbi:LPS translocon maturation chaperone LptM [Gallibacterium salpingitidis]|nr:lipoprotein [Gallibacterium salpingitidis]
MMTIIISCFCLSLTACGVKGPLYQPAKDQPVQQENTTK